ncbi:MAG: hypothetical protein K8R21_03970 [Leptospira sp.]|nr:hypothetical protein [Leptospira sp.]
MQNEIQSNPVEKIKKLKLFSFRKSLGDVMHLFPSMGLAENCRLIDTTSLCGKVNVKNTTTTQLNCLTVNELKEMEDHSPCPECFQFLENS